MGNCTSKSSARDVVSTPRKDELKDGAFKYNKNNRQVVYVGEHSRDDNLIAKASIGASASTSITSEESSPINDIPDASKPSLLGEIREYLDREDDASTQVTARRGSPAPNSNNHQDRSSTDTSLTKEHGGEILHINSGGISIVSPLPFEGEQTDTTREENSDDNSIEINDMDSNTEDLIEPLTIEGESLVNSQLTESLIKAQALLGEVSGRREREKSEKMKGSEETQSVEIVNVSETDCARNRNSDSGITPEPDVASGIFSYDTMDCENLEEEEYWKEMQSGQESPCTNPDDDTSFHEKTLRNVDRNEESSIIRVVPCISQYSYDNDSRDQYLRKDTIQLAPTTETEAESLEEIIDNGEEVNDSNEDNESVDTSEWSESMTELIKLCEEESTPRNGKGGTVSPGSDRRQVTLDNSRSQTTKAEDNLSLLGNIPERSSPGFSFRSGTSVNTEGDKLGEGYSKNSPSIPETLKISRDALISQNCSPLATPLESPLTERKPLDIVPKVLDDEISRVIDDISPHNADNKTMSANNETDREPSIDAISPHLADNKTVSTNKEEDKEPLIDDISPHHTDDKAMSANKEADRGPSEIVMTNKPMLANEETERNPLETVPTALVDGIVEVSDDASSHHVGNNPMMANEGTEAPILSKISTLEAVTEEKTLMCEVPTLLTKGVASNSLVPDENLSKAQFDDNMKLASTVDAKVVLPELSVATESVTEDTAATKSYTDETQATNDASSLEIGITSSFDVNMERTTVEVAESTMKANEDFPLQAPMLDPLATEKSLGTDQSETTPVKEETKALPSLDKLGTFATVLSDCSYSTPDKEDYSFMSEQTEQTEEKSTNMDFSLLSSPIAETNLFTPNDLMSSTLKVDSLGSYANMQQPDPITVAHLTQVPSCKSRIQRLSLSTSSPMTGAKVSGPENAETSLSRSQQKESISSRSPMISKSPSQLSAGLGSKSSIKKKATEIANKSISQKKNASVTSKSQFHKKNISIAARSPMRKKSTSITTKSPVQKTNTDDKLASMTPITRRRRSAIPQMKSPPAVRSPSPYKKSRRQSSIPSVSSHSVTPSTHRKQMDSPINSPFLTGSSINNINTGVPLQILTREGTPGELSLDTYSTTPLSRPWDEGSQPSDLRAALLARCASPADSESVISTRSSSSIMVRERQAATQNRISSYRSPKTCGVRWNSTLFRSRRPCARCYSLASEKEKGKFELNGHSTVITLTSGGCSKSCTQFFSSDGEAVVLCRICFHATHRPATTLVEEGCRALEY